MPKKTQGRVFWESLATRDTSEESEKVLEQRGRLLKHWAQHPWNWLAGTDPTDPKEPNRPLIYTIDQKDREHPRKAFPVHFAYIRHYIELLHTRRMVIVDKCRQMFVSNATLLYIDWEARFIANRRWLVSRHKEDDAIELLEDKIRAVHRELPEWVKIALPQKEKPQKKIYYPDSGSVVVAVPENVAKSEARGGSGSVMIDEGAFQDGFGDIVAAAAPMVDKLFAVSTPNIGSPGAEAYRRLLDQGKEKVA